MEKLFGIPLPTLMFILSGIFIATMLVVIGMALRNPVMFKLGIRPISRRPGMTVLIIIGVMLSTIIISAAFGTADTLSYSIRDIGINGLGTIDEIIISARSQEGDRFGQSFISMERYEELRSELAGDDRIDGIMPQFTQNVPAVNPAEDLSEGQFNLLGIDPALLGGFGGLKLASGGNADVQALGPNETFINEDASGELDLQAGGELEVYVEDSAERFVVKGVLEDGGFAGIDSTMIISLDRAQEIFGRTGQITSIIISNRGDALSGNELSEEVTKDLRVKFTDRETASRLKDLLNDDVFLKALELERDTAADTDRKDRLTKVLTGIRSPDITDDLIDALADTEISEAIQDILDTDEMRDLQREATTLFSELSEMYVLDIKNDILRGAEQAGTAISVFFLTFSTFSIASGILLIFLIFVLLAGARKSEMGMARAVGAKRRNLIEMFVFEGTAYALVSAAVGVVLGLAVSGLMVGILNSVFSTFDDDFTLKLHFTLPTIVVSYCLGNDHHLRNGRHFGLPRELSEHRGCRAKSAGKPCADKPTEFLEPSAQCRQGHLPACPLPLARTALPHQARPRSCRAPGDICPGVADHNRLGDRRLDSAVQAGLAVPFAGLASLSHRRRSDCSIHCSPSLTACIAIWRWSVIGASRDGTVGKSPFDERRHAARAPRPDRLHDNRNSNLGLLGIAARRPRKALGRYRG